jgi:hypothetical protein
MDTMPVPSALPEFSVARSRTDVARFIVELLVSFQEILSPKSL